MAQTPYTLVRKDVRYSAFPNVKQKYAYITGVKTKPFTGAPSAFTLVDVNVHSYTNLNSPGMNTAPPDCHSTAFHDVAFGRIFDPLSSMDNTMQLCYNRAYSKWSSKISETADMGAALAEWRSTVDMVNNRTFAAYQRARLEAVKRVERRARDLVRGYRALRKGRFREFLSTLGVKPKKKHEMKRWNKPKDAAGLWLEYWFGWSPTVNDIYNAVNLWQSPVPDAAFSAASSFQESRVTSYSNTDDSLVRNSWTGKFIVRLQARVRISNPNLYEANRLGLTNPAAVAWEVVPFSFLIDWFVNVGEVIGGYTSELGLEITDRQVLRFFKGDSSSVMIGNKNYPSYLYGWDCKAKVALVKREVGLFPSPMLTYALPRISWTRAATAVSLLVSVFSHKLP